MSLPADVLDYILSFLQSDTDTLKACSRSHPILSQLVERYLYTSITLRDDISLEASELNELLHNRPHVANYVFALEIEFAYGTDQKALGPFLEAISFILPMLTMLRKIRLSHTRPATVTWQMLPEKFYLAFLDCLRLPSMTTICIEFFAFPLSALTQCKHIGNLSIRGWSHGSETVIVGGNHTPFPTIDSLALHDCCPRFLDTISNWTRSRNISTLEFSDTSFGRSFNNLPRILICCSHSLTSLDVDIGKRYTSYYDFKRSNTISHPDEYIPIPLSVLPNLHQLTIRARFVYIASNKEPSCLGTWGFLSPIPAIADVLKPASSLKQITLDFYFFIKAPHGDQHRIVDVVCGPLQSLLVQSASAIDTTNLRIRSPSDIPVVPEIILSSLADHSDLAQLVEHGSLILAPVILDFQPPVASIQPQIVVPPRPSASSSTTGRTSYVLRKWSKLVSFTTSSSPSARLCPSRLYYAPLIG